MSWPETDAVLDALGAAVVQHPADDERRMVFADRLEELGRDTRAAFIRAQLRGEVAGDLFVDMYGGGEFVVDKRVPSICNQRFVAQFRRGFVHSILTTLRHMGDVDTIAHLIRTQPVEHVHLEGKEPLQVARGAWEWTRWWSDAHNYIPKYLFRFLLGGDMRTSYQMVYPTQDAAVHAFSRAVILYWRST